MRLATSIAWLTLAGSITGVAFAAPPLISLDEALPSVSRENLRIGRVRRGGLIHRVEAGGSTRWRDNASVEAVLTVPARRLPDVMIGQPAVVGLDSALHRGRVSGIRPLGGEDFEVTVSLGSLPALSRRAAGSIGASQRVVASIRTGETPDVLLLRGAGPLSAGATVSWFKLEPGHSGIATRVPVRIGATTPDRAEIAGGLAEGDRVVTAGLEVVPADVQRIRIR